MDEKKSYAGLIVWTICFLLLTLACPFLGRTEITLRCIMQLCSLGVTVLVYMIYVNEKVYWINGVSFEEALKATSEQRKRYAFRHLKCFLWFAVPYFFFSLISYLLGWSAWIDFTLGTVGLCTAAIATVPIKLE